jgi:hypothetical protein
VLSAFYLEMHIYRTKKGEISSVLATIKDLTYPTVSKSLIPEDREGFVQNLCRAYDIL